ncbi:hypothetical protein C8U37_101186 [Trichococcus patagoniensis]|uniref:Uncharacterized protein n=1 Tax=Trichococcus patagoniensis TaxID=382641 RepID=A0A2T5IRB2_9LACT|nr:hypothetical protein C8U37_101186 [Trichococcus patagoniensis]
MPKAQKGDATVAKQKRIQTMIAPILPYYPYKSLTNLLKVFVFHKCVQDFFDHIPFFIRFDRL